MMVQQGLIPTKNLHREGSVCQWTGETLTCRFSCWIIIQRHVQVCGSATYKHPVREAQFTYLILSLPNLVPQLYKVPLSLFHSATTLVNVNCISTEHTTAKLRAQCNVMRKALSPHTSARVTRPPERNLAKPHRQRWKGGLQVGAVSVRRATTSAERCSEGNHKEIR